MDKLLPSVFWVLLLLMPIAAFRFIFTALDSPELASEGDSHATDFSRCREVYYFVVWIGLGGIFFLGLDAIFYRAARWMGLDLPFGWREGSMLFAFTIAFLAVFFLIMQLDEVHATLLRLNKDNAASAILRGDLMKLVEELDYAEASHLHDVIARFAASKMAAEDSALVGPDKELLQSIFNLVRKRATEMHGIALPGDVAVTS